MARYLLAIDVGNTQTVMGLYLGDELVRHWRLHTDPNRTTDETRLWLRSLLEMEGYAVNTLRGAVVSSVVPSVTARFRAVGEGLTGRDVIVIEPGIRTGMSILIDNPREVGADRIVNSVAARERYGSPVIVVDFGTSTNFDVVGPEGSYLGGAIAPGLVIATNALIAGAAALRNVEFLPPRSPIGKGTVEAIQSGALYGHAGLVDGIMQRIEAELGGDVTKIATGGLASTIVPHCRSVDRIDEFLTLDGLRMIYDLNIEDS
jgi:type III pantothenate kinase